jgi:hypothetical protein
VLGRGGPPPNALAASAPATLRERLERMLDAI